MAGWCAGSRWDEYTTLDVFGRHDDCDRLSRRSFLRVGFLGLGGLTLADHLRLRAAAKKEGKPTRELVG